MTETAGRRPRRHGTAAVEFAGCLPLIVLLMSGMWEVGRITEVLQVMWNSGRESARDASLGRDNMLTVANNLQIYLQSAEPTAFPGAGHTTNMITPVITLPANTTGYTCWDGTTGKELFTVTFTDITKPTVTDPTGMSQLERYEITVSAPYANVAWSPLAQITGVTRLSITLDWVSMVDSPFQVPASLPAQ
jgi:hypothetical protein